MKRKYNKALVTGGAGFIGSHMVESLVSDGYQVAVLDNLSSGSLSNLEMVQDRIRFFKGNIQDKHLLEKAIQGCDIVFHFAGMVSVPRSVAEPLESALINEVGTLSVLESARHHRVKRVVFASSCAVYGDDPALPKHESQATNPLSPYALQKIIGEEYLRLFNRLYGLETVSLRFFNVYGPRQDAGSAYSGVISLFMSKAVTGENPVIYGDGSQIRDFVYVKDVVRANMLAADAETANGYVLNIGTGKQVSISKLWEKISSLSGKDVEPVFKPERPGDIEKSVADIQEAGKILGFSPKYSLGKGLEMTYDWYRNRG